MSTATNILETIRTKLEDISILNGYNSDAGQRVILGNLPLDENDIYPCIVVTEESVDPGVQQPVKPVSGKVNVLYKLEVIGAVATVDMLLDGHKYVSDLMNAMAKGDNPSQLGGLQGVSRLDYRGWAITPRELGTVKTAAAIYINVNYVERYGVTT